MNFTISDDILVILRLHINSDPGNNVHGHQLLDHQLAGVGEIDLHNLVSFLLFIATVAVEVLRVSSLFKLSDSYHPTF